MFIQQLFKKLKEHVPTISCTNMNQKHDAFISLIIGFVRIISYTFDPQTHAIYQLALVLDLLMLIAYFCVNGKLIDKRVIFPCTIPTIIWYTVFLTTNQSFHINALFPLSFLQTLIFHTHPIKSCLTFLVHTIYWPIVTMSSILGMPVIYFLLQEEPRPTVCTLKLVPCKHYHVPIHCTRNVTQIWWLLLLTE